MNSTSRTFACMRAFGVLATLVLALAICCLAPQAHADEPADTLYNNLIARFAAGGADAAIDNRTFIAAPALALAGRSSSIDANAIIAKLNAARSAATPENPFTAGQLGKYIIALTAAGKDCTALQNGNTTSNLIEEMEGLMTTAESVYSAVVILPAYDYGCYNSSKSPVSKDALIKIILDSQAESGLFGGEWASAQVTAQAILALQPYRTAYPNIAAALDKAQEALWALQDADGGLRYDPGEYSTATDVSTTGEACAALVTLGIDPTGKTNTQAVNNKGKTPYDALVSNANNKMNGYDGQWDEPMAAAYALAGLVCAKKFDPSSPMEHSLYTPLPNGATWKRLGGPVALDTMSLIVDEGSFPAGGTVVLATMEGYWDALTASGVAGLAKAPILLTEKTVLSKQTAAQLTKLAPKNIIVCGGPAAITEDVATAASAAAGNAKVVRMYGEDALGTANNIFAKAAKETGSPWAGTEAFLCTAATFQDALSAAPLSYALHIPIFLTLDANTITPETLKAMKDGGIKNVFIVGGTKAIDESVEKTLKNNGIAVADRFAGKTSIETSELVAQFGFSRTMTADKMGIATCWDYYDALAGAPLCGNLNSVIVLVNSENPASISDFVRPYANNIWNGYIFGGPAAVGTGVELELEHIAYGPTRDRYPEFGFSRPL